jgi:uncharacterized protein (TIGR03083 family)
MEHQAHLDGIRSEIVAMATVLEGKDPTAPVPACPDWDLAELIRHTGQVHRWVTAIVKTRSQEFLGWKDLDLGLPADASGLPSWLAAGAAPLLTELAADPTTPVWSFAPDKSVGWWARRLLHETTVHRADAELSLGLQPQLAPEVALDGIAELLVDLLPISEAPKRIAALGWTGQSLHLHATDAPGEWTLTFTDTGFECADGHQKASAAVRGSVGDLLLLLWNRRRASDAERFELFGDRELVDGWLGATAL